MGIIKYLRKVWHKPSKVFVRDRLVVWRKEPSCVKIDNPTRPDRARALGFRRKQGIFLVRMRVPRGGHSRPKRTKGRRSKTQTRRLTLRKNYQLIAEERASKKYSNCEVLNSYPVAKDGKHAWFEMILVDRAHPSVKADHRTAFISKQRGRAHRGLTSAGKKVRGLRNKGKGAEKARPSRRANDRRI